MYVLKIAISMAAFLSALITTTDVSGSTVGQLPGRQLTFGEAVLNESQVAQVKKANGKTVTIRWTEKQQKELVTKFPKCFVRSIDISTHHLSKQNKVGLQVSNDGKTLKPVLLKE